MEKKGKFYCKFPSNLRTNRYPAETIFHLECHPFPLPIPKADDKPLFDPMARKNQFMWVFFGLTVDFSESQGFRDQGLYWNTLNMCLANPHEVQLCPAGRFGVDIAKTPTS